ADPHPPSAARHVRDAQQSFGSAHVACDGHGRPRRVRRCGGGDAGAAESPSPARGSRAVRARQPERGVRRHRSAVWFDRGDSETLTMPTDLSTTFTGLRFANPFLLSSAPPTESESNIMRAFDAGWGGVVTKTIGLHPVVNVYGAKAKFMRTSPDNAQVSMK